MGHTHPNSGSQMVGGKLVPRGGSYYASIDGSVQFFQEPWQADSWAWFSKVPSGKMQTMGAIPNPSWNWWNAQ
jgi:hypothetical protein